MREYCLMTEGIVPEGLLINKIYLIRGQRVMLDKDLAHLYGVKAIRLREQVFRNKIRFPSNFMFQLTDEEVTSMVSQNAIPSRRSLGGTFPYAFTEHGILMLANVLKSEPAIRMSITIIEIFVKLRETLQTHKEVLIKLDDLERSVLKHDENIARIFECLREILNPATLPMRKIGFKIPSQE